MSSVSKNRIRIFDYWQMQEPSLESQPPLKRSEQSYIADDLISETQKLLSNITQFLEGKRVYTIKISQFKMQANDLLATLHEACNSDTEDLDAAEHNVNLYRANLKKLYFAIRNAKILLNRITLYFQNANLANYDRSLTKLTFTQSSEAMHHQLTTAITTFRIAIHRLMEAQRLADSKKQLSNIFGKDSTPQYCLERLQQLQTHDTTVKIHFLMLFQLEQMQKSVDQLRQFIKVSQNQYLKYELILDCITLMRDQTKQMKDQLRRLDRQLQFACTHPKQVDFRAISSQNESQKEVWRHNSKIYEANLQNFTRVNAETSMLYYSLLKAQFVQQYDSFSQGISAHEINGKSLVFLLDRQSLLNDILRRTEIVGKASESDRRLSLSIYNECSNHEIPRESFPLSSLKENLLSQIQLYLVNNGIAYNKRAKDKVSLDQQFLKHQILIEQIESQPPSQQYGFIASKIKHINGALLQIETFLSDRDKIFGGERLSESARFNKIRTIGSYRLAFMYAIIIGKAAPFKTKLQDFQKLKQAEGFEELPIKFQIIVFNYIKDINIFEQSKLLTVSVHSSVEKVSESLRQSVSKSTLRTNLDSLLEKQLSILSKIWFELYDCYLRKMSIYGQQLLLDRVDEISSIITELVSSSLPEKVQLINSRTMDIDRKIFFTHRILTELVALTDSVDNIQSLKITNLQRILQQIFRNLDREFINKSIGGKINQIIKLSILEQYFRIVYHPDSNPKKTIRKLKFVAYLQSVSELYPNSSNSKQSILQALLEIQFRLNSVTLTLKYNDQLKNFLAQRVPPLIREIRKFPLTIAAKHDISGFASVFRFSEIIEELKASIKGPFLILSIAAIFVCISGLKDARKATDFPFDSYENLLVKEKKSLCEYFENVRKIFRPKIESIEREIELISKNYLNKDESVSLTRAVQLLCKKVQ